MTAITSRAAVADEPDRSQSGSRLGQLPLIALLAGIGLLTCSVTDALARATLAPATIAYWIGILVIGLPIFYRLSSPQPSSGERLTLVCLLGMTLYAVKLARDSLVYTLADEFTHAFNAEQIVQHHHLFESNPAIPITPDFPGLEGATSALMATTGMTSFGAGIIVIGAARLCLIMGLFFLFRRISGSARIAGLGAAIYAGSSNFLLWGAQYSYQSLALPLLVVILMLFAERAATPRSWAPAWATVIVLLTAAVVMTHHLTSYALAAILILLALMYWWPERKWDWPNPWPYAVYTLGFAAFWLLVVAFGTIDYLSPVVERAVNSVADTITGASSPRALFQGSATDPRTTAAASAATPTLARIVSLGSVAILALGLPFGLREVWRRFRTQPFALLFCIGAIGFFGVLALRFAPEAWETSNRAGEFLFIGLSFVLAFAFLFAYARVDGRGPRSAPWLGRALLTGSLGVVLAGGAISGWPWDAQLPRPLRVKADDGGQIESEPLAAATWGKDHLPDGKFAAAQGDALLLIAPGNLTARAGRHPDFADIIDKESFLKPDCVRNCETSYAESFAPDVMRGDNLRYIVADRRLKGSDTIRGFSFSVRPPGAYRDALLPEQTILKFEQVQTAARLYDSGNIVIYDMGPPQ